MRRVALKEVRGVTRARLMTKTKATMSAPTTLRTSERRSPSRTRHDHGGEPCRKLKKTDTT